MNTKLTLTIDSQTIKEAKQYAKKNKTSLSRLVEFYFRAITSTPEKSIQSIPPITRSLTGIASFKTDKSDKELLADALNRKFM